jgi:MFS transporter, DHA1 family, inner membrane transport protein
MLDRRLVLLAFGSFVVTVDGTLVIGLLRQIARSLSASPAAAGQAVTLFAVVYALGAPLLIRSTSRRNGRDLLVAALALFALANAATAAAPSLIVLLAARILAACCAGVFMATAAALAGRTAAHGRRGRALATVVGGASAATALGVPLGTFLGDILGWRMIFYGIAVLTALVAVAISTLPSTPEAASAMITTLRRADILLTLATTLLWSTGSFTFFTYVAIVLHHTASVGTAGLAAFLLLFGIAGIAGAVLAGWATDKKGSLPTLMGGLTLVIASLTALGITAAVASATTALAASAAAVAGYGIGTWAITPSQQHRLLARGSDDRLFLALNASALYAGVAAGSGIVGALLAATGSIEAICWVAAAIELVALATLATRRSTTGAADRSSPA